MYRKIVWHQIAYLEIFRGFIWLLRKPQFFGYCATCNYFATAHLPIIWPQQIDLLFHLWDSSKYLLTLHRKIVWQLQIAYLEIFRRYIWLLRKAKLFGYCASYNYFPTAHLPIICLLQIDQFFHHWKSPKYLFTVHRKILIHVQIAYLATFQRFIGVMR